MLTLAMALSGASLPDQDQCAALARDPAARLQIALLPGEGLALAQQAPPDLVLLDIQLPGMSGLDGLRLLRQACPRARIVLVSASVAPDAIHEARARGADGFLPKSASAEDILEAISCALSGQPCFPINSGNSATTRGPDTPSLTARQLDVLSLLCTGKPNKVIARDLGLSENTVRVHVAAIFAQLGVNSRSAALLAAQRLGLSTPQLHDSL